MISNNPSTGADDSGADRTAAAADRMTGAADDALQSTRRGVGRALDGAEASVHRARDRAAPAVSHLAGQAESLARRGMDAVRDTGYQVGNQVRNRAAQARERAGAVTDRTTGYVRDEPLKSILIAAAAGAALMALISLLGSNSRRDD